MMTTDSSTVGQSGAERSSDDDVRLVQRCLRGDQAAWTELLSKYKNLIYSIPIKYGFSQDDASDVFQSVCVDLLNELVKLREPRALAGWLIRVTHNRCFHMVKNRKREVSQDDEPFEPPIPAEKIPENVLHELEREQLLRVAIHKLGARCQALVRMLFYQTPPPSYEEIAKSMALATGSIGFIRARCLEKLRNSLVAMGFA